MQWATAVGLEKKRDREQTENRETNHRGHSYPRWIVAVSGPIFERMLAFESKGLLYNVNSRATILF